MNSTPLDMSLATFPTEIHPQDGVLVIGDLHANPLKAIYLMILTGRFVGLEPIDYQTLRDIYQTSYRLAEAFYDSNRKFRSADNEVKRSGPRLELMERSYKQRKLVDGKPVTEQRVQGARALHAQNQQAYDQTKPKYEQDKKAFLDDLRKNLPTFMAIIRKVSPADGTHLLRLEGDEQYDRGACDIFVRALLKILIEKAMEYDVLLSNHGIFALLNDPKEAAKLDSGKMQAISGIMMQWVEKEGQDILEAAGLTNFMQEVHIPRMKLWGYVLKDGGILEQDTHAPVDLTDLKAQVEFLGLPTVDPKSTHDYLVMLDTINERVRAYAREGRLKEILWVGDVKGLEPEALAFVRKHNPINFICWNRDTKCLDRPAIGEVSVWRHGHDKIAYEAAHLQCVDSVFGMADIETQPADEKTKVYLVTQGQTCVAEIEAVKMAPEINLHRRLFMIIAGNLQIVGGIFPKDLFAIADVVKSKKELELRSYLVESIRELESQGLIAGQSKHIRLMLDMLQVVEEFENRHYPGAHFLRVLKARVQRDFGDYKRGRGLEKYTKLMAGIDQLLLTQTHLTPQQLLNVKINNDDTLGAVLSVRRIGNKKEPANAFKRVNREINSVAMDSATLKFLTSLMRNMRVSKEHRDRFSAFHSALLHVKPKNLEELCLLKAVGYESNLLQALSEEPKAYTEFCEFFDLNDMLGKEKINEILQDGNSKEFSM